MNLSLIWFSLLFLFLFLEMGHPGLFYFLAFSCGSLCSCIAALYDVSHFLQFFIFMVSTCIALMLIHLLLKNKKHDLAPLMHRSNNEALIGKKVFVYKSPLDDHTWYAKVLGQVWVVKTVHHQPLHEGQQVIIIDVQGSHLRVDTMHTADQ